MKRILILGLILLAVPLVMAAWQRNYTPEIPIIVINPVTPTPSATSTPTPTLTPSIRPKQPPPSVVIPMRTHTFQSFNNCGPASLSMLFSYFDINISQYELGMRLRPYQHPHGDNDDKSVKLDELAEESTTYNFVAFHRPMGSLEILKTLIANDIPVVVRTLLHLNEDIGHYRLVRGYDDTTGEIIQDDSYENKNLRFSYDTFLALWKPFNYEYLVAVPTDKEALAKAILGADVEARSAWEKAYTNATDEATRNPTDIYALFNQSIALFHLEQYEESIEIFESVQSRLPMRTLWYKVEPLEAYLILGRYDKVFELSESMLVNNRAFSEVYIARGRVYQAQGNTELAQAEFQKASLYNSGELVRRRIQELTGVSN